MDDFYLAPLQICNVNTHLYIFPPHSHISALQIWPKIEFKPTWKIMANVSKTTERERDF